VKVSHFKITLCAMNMRPRDTRSSVLPARDESKFENDMMVLQLKLEGELSAGEPCGRQATAWQASLAAGQIKIWLAHCACLLRPQLPCR
jgi:hypothetical protein